jgi:DNA processing protein
MPNECALLLQLMQTKGIGPRSLARLLDRLEADSLSLQDFFDVKPEEMVVRFGLNAEQASSVHEHQETATQVADLLDEKGVCIVLRGSPAYPARLKSVLADKAPPVLFMAGTPDLLRQRCLGFCGARDASKGALGATVQLARALVKRGLPEDCKDALCV